MAIGEGRTANAPVRRRSVTVKAGAALALLAVASAGCGLAPSAADVAGHIGGSGSSTPPGSSTTGSGRAQSTPAPTPSDVSGKLIRFYEQKLQWKSCMNGPFECSKLLVPVDYSKPDGKTIELAMLRVPAKKSDSKVGSLVINQGGPGAPGVTYALSAPLLFGSSVKDNFDIVGFDPRGVGASAPVDCISDKDLDAFIALDGSPDTPQEEQALQGEAKKFADGCKKRTGELLEHLSTTNVARDMDVLRGALGDRELYYYGASYGTYLGATYAELFPKRVGRLTLDGALDPALTGTQVAYGQAKGFEVALKSYLEHCIDNGDCPVGSTLEEAYDNIDTLLADLDRNPLPTDSPRKLTQALAVSGMITAMYTKGFWAHLSAGLKSAMNGDGTGLLDLSDTGTTRQSDGTYQNNQNELILAVNCLDRPDVSSISDAEGQEARFKQASPRFGASILWGGFPCSQWPYPVAGKPHKITAPGTKPILVLGTLRDPATPYQWAQKLAGDLASGVLLTLDDDGHTAYSEGPPCVKDTVDKYLVTGEAPQDGITCQSS